jgi:hypothetical protein
MTFAKRHLSVDPPSGSKFARYKRSPPQPRANPGLSRHGFVAMDDVAHANNAFRAVGALAPEDR